MGPLRFDDIGEKLSFFISNLDETATKKNNQNEIDFCWKKKRSEIAFTACIATPHDYTLSTGQNNTI